MGRIAGGLGERFLSSYVVPAAVRSRQTTGKQVDKSLGWLLVRETKVLLALHVPFHEEIRKEVEIDGRENEGGVLTAPGGMLLHLLEWRAKSTAELLRPVIEHFPEILILEFNHIAEQPDEVFGPLIPLRSGHGGTRHWAGS